jgi:hypothetical protein
VLLAVLSRVGRRPGQHDPEVVVVGGEGLTVLEPSDALLVALQAPKENARMLGAVDDLDLADDFR